MNFLPKMPEGAKSPKATMILSWVLGFAVCLLVAPFVLAAIGGLIGLIVAGAVGLAAIRFAPWFSMRLSNTVMKLIMQEAYDNPIPTLKNEFMARTEELRQQREQAEQFNNSVYSYEGQLGEMKRTHPEDVQMFQEHLNAMKELRDQEFDALADAHVALQKFDKEIDRAEMIWKMTQAANSLSSKAARLSQKDAIRKISTDTALSSVRDSMAASFAKLDSVRRLREQRESGDQGPVKITSQPSNVIDMPVKAAAKVRV